MYTYTTRETDNMEFKSATIYKITSSNHEGCYIGSTHHPIEKRLKKHKADFKNFKNGNFHFITSFIILEAEGDIKIESLINIQYVDKKLLYVAEAGCIIFHENSVNKCIPGRTGAQYHRDNIEQIHIYKNTKNNCPCGGKYTNAHKAVHMKTKKHKRYLENQ